MILPPFRGPALKVERAKRLIQELSERVMTFGRDNPAEVFFSTDKGYPSISMPRRSAPLPEDIPLLVGDAVHNLRSSLDLMICDAAVSRGKSAKNLKFPFAKNGEELEDSLNDLKKIGQDIIDLVRSLKPYKNGNIGLRGLHDLDISDKHRLVIPIAQHDLYDLCLTYISYNGTTHVVNSKELVSTRPSAPDLNIRELNIVTELPPDYYRICVVFAPSMPFAGEPVLKTLETLTELVDGTVNTFATLCLAAEPES